jgi:DNA-binding beta-propeller fold protein YncE
MGDCAAPPEGVYTYGEIGIGSCLASPADITFFTGSQGGTYLGVANANHYLNFSSGSVLVIDWDTVEKDNGAKNLLSDLTTSADAPSNYIGGVAYVPSRNLLLATERLSEGRTSTTGQDDLLVYEATDPRALSSWQEGATLTLEDDPQQIVVDDANGRAFVLNLTDHSVSVIDLTTSPLSKISVSEGAGLFPESFEDTDDSGSTAAFSRLEILDDADLIEDEWDFSYIQGTHRLWVPTQSGLARWHAGGTAWTPTGSGVEVDPETAGLSVIEDPFLLLVDGLPGLYFSNEGAIHVAGAGDGTATNWTIDSSSIFSVDDPDFEQNWLSGPTLVNDSRLFALYYDQRAEEFGDASVSMALPDSTGLLQRAAEPLFTPPEGFLSVEDPFVVYDELHKQYRMWVSLWDGSLWHIGESSSLDGLVWSELALASGLPENVAAPVVSRERTLFLMHYSRLDDGDWVHGEAWSWNGNAFREPVDRIVSTAANPSTRTPPRVAVQPQEHGAFRIRGVNAGLIPGTALPGISFAVADFGFSFQIAAGQTLDGEDVHDNFANGLTPGSAATLNATEVLYVHGVGLDGTQHIGLFSAESTPPVLINPDILPEEALGTLSQPGHPVVFSRDGTNREMVFSATSTEGEIGLYLATSEDGLSWTVNETPVLNDELVWHSVSKRAHSTETLEDGGLRLWYAGFDGSRYRIGSALWSDELQAFSAEAGSNADWQFEAGSLGSFDDTHVSDPAVFVADGQTHMLYSAFDGERWSVGSARRAEDGQWIRSVDGYGEPRPALVGPDFTFSQAGVDSPVVTVTESGVVRVWYGGLDNVEELATRRLGYGEGSPADIYAMQAFPTLGDSFTMVSHRSTFGTDVIELAQQIDAFSTSGTGGSSLTLDAERGFLFITSKLHNFIYVLDVRDDSTDTFNDRNVYDIEALIAVESNIGSRGFRDVVLVPGTERMYATGQRPDAVVVFDLTRLEDNGEKEVYSDLAVSTLPLQPSSSLNSDAGVETGLPASTRFGGAGMALTDSGLLLVPQFLDNSVSIFDIARGTYGEEIAYLPYLGENPHTVAISPDQKYAVVANYVGEKLEAGATSSTLVVIDIDPASPRYLQPSTWIANQ